MKNLLISFILILLFVSCAQDNPYSTEEFSEESFGSWLAKHDPKAEPFVDQNGAINKHIYLRFNKRGPEPADSQKLVNYAWFYTSYTGYTLDGTIFATRDSLQSRLVGKWKNTTHWVDDFLQVYESNGSFSSGLYKVVQTLRPGDSLRIYLEGAEAFFSYAMNLNAGYQGENTKYIGFPIYFDMVIKNVVHTPIWAEQDSVNRFAKKRYNLNIQDTVKKGLYMFVTQSKPKNDIITKDTIVQLHYTQRFLDGFYISSTSDSIAKREKRYNPASAENPSGERYGVVRNKPDENSGLPRAVYECVKKMRKGETAEVISISTWTKQGNSGSFSALPQIMPYQPVLYKIEVAEKVSSTI